MIPDDKRKIDDPELNKDTSSYDKDETFEDSDDFHKYDETANLDQNDPVVKSDDSTNNNAKTSRPTFNRTYDKIASDETLDSDKFDGNINI